MSKTKRKTNNNGLKIPRVPRYLVNPLEHAIAGAVKPDKADIKQITDALHESIENFRKGIGKEKDWCVIAGAIMLGQAIEKNGIVRGLSSYFLDFEKALQTIYDRCTQNGAWCSPTLWHHELQSLQDILKLHSYQLQQLSRSEMEFALNMATKKIAAQGVLSRWVILKPRPMLRLR